MTDDLEYTVEFDIEAIATKLAAAEALAIECDKVNEWFGTDDALNWNFSFEPPWYQDWRSALRQYREAANG